jgi:hypothetical protein
VPITPFLREGSFDPETVRAMSLAFVNACQSLGLTDRTDSMTKIVALQIIEAASDGERDPVKLYEAVMIWAARVA